MKWHVLSEILEVCDRPACAVWGSDVTGQQSAVGQRLTSQFSRLAPRLFHGEGTLFPTPSDLKSESNMNSTQPGELKTWKPALESGICTGFPPAHPRNLSGTM